MSGINTCYSFITGSEAVSVAAVYRVADGKIGAVPNSGGVSPDLSELEAIYADSWLRNIMGEMSS
jgi:sulfide dehydrogenase [flavocytochrome c] flavoprotein subunit